MESSAPGKVILCGEHSVVYGEPAIAVPVTALRCRARMEPAMPGSGLLLVAADLNQRTPLRAAAPDYPLAALARLVLEHLNCGEPDAVLTIHSELPIAAGLGSGAAVSVAAARALAGFLGHVLSEEVVSALAYEVEKLHHGTPSGIDNTVIAWERPVFFIKGQTPEVLAINVPLCLLIADSGFPAATREVVAGVRQRRESDPDFYNTRFARIGALVRRARIALEQQDLSALGQMLDANHALLVEIGVSTPRLEALVQTARLAGALGAKLTGSGMGGNIIALVPMEEAPAVAGALRAAGAAHVWQTVTT
ncbi:MAG: mevalonate kinase [Anaerolineae bacterium]|nr:mevalonate kinase [Anaerolineae bacterium]